MAFSPWVSKFIDIHVSKIEVTIEYIQYMKLYALWWCTGLSHPVFTGVMKKGYRVPTPIQRKVITLSCKPTSELLYVSYYTFCSVFHLSWMEKMLWVWPEQGLERLPPFLFLYWRD